MSVRFLGDSVSRLLRLVPDRPMRPGWFGIVQALRRANNLPRSPSLSSRTLAGRIDPGPLPAALSIRS